MPTDVSHRPLLPGHDLRPLREIWRRPDALTWEATLGEHGPRLAIRAMTRAGARVPEAARAFRLRQREVARLGHPGVLGPLAVGMIDATLAARSGGHLPEGAPAVALPWLPGSRVDPTATWPWPRLRALLDAALEALAHAHAREVLHLDLRASALLRPAAGGVQLLDFGTPVPGEDGIPRVAAELGAAAPELMDADWPRIGPWTDVYGLAVLAWHLATGERPHQGPNRRAIRFRQLEGRTAAFASRTPMPPGLAPLLRTWLAPDPAARARSAAGARHALAQLGETPPAATLDEPTASARRPPQVAVRSVAAVPARRVDPAAGALRATLPLPLSRLRDAPTVGREAEQDALWAALAETDRTGEARMIVLEGPSGSGRSHLARWLGLRAIEEDLVDGVMHAHHDDAWEGGLAAAARRLLRLDRVPPAALRDAVTRALAGLRLPWEGLGDALIDWLDPRARAPDWPEAGLLHGLLLALSRGRPVVLLVRDLDRDEATGSAIGALLRRQGAEPVPVLVVATVARAASLGAVRASGRVQRIQLGALRPDAAHGLAAHLAPVGRRAARALHTGSGGLPLDLRLATWVGQAGDAPFDRGQGWARRLASAVKGPDEAALLARAAVLGRHVDRQELEAAWPRALPQDLAERLEDEGLGVRTRTGWRFAHESLHAHVLRMAHDRAAHHLACAEALEGMDLASWGPAHQVRIARHRLGAGDTSAAWRAGMAAAEEAEAQARTAVLLAALRVCAAALPAGSGGRRRVELDLRLCIARTLQGGADAEHAGLRAAIAAADAARAPDLALRGAAAWVRCGGPPTAVGLRERVARGHGLDGHADALLALAAAQAADDRPGMAYALAEQARALPPASASSRQLAEAAALCARALLSQGDPVEAGAQARGLLRSPRAETGARPRAVARQVLAEVAAAHQRPEEALRQWQAARAEARRLDDDPMLARIDAEIALLRSWDGSHGEAAAVAGAALARSARTLRPALRLHLAALAEDWAAWDAAARDLGRPGRRDRPHAVAAVERARGSGQGVRAEALAARLP